MRLLKLVNAQHLPGAIEITLNSSAELGSKEPRRVGDFLIPTAAFMIIIIYSISPQPDQSFATVKSATSIKFLILQASCLSHP